MPRYRLAKFNPQRCRSWGVSPDWLSKQHQGYLGSKVWGHIDKTYKIMAKGTYQLPSCTLMELLHFNVGWLYGLDLINDGFTYIRAHKLYRK